MTNAQDTITFNHFDIAEVHLDEIERGFQANVDDAWDREAMTSLDSLTEVDEDDLIEAYGEEISDFVLSFDVTAEEEERQDYAPTFYQPGEYSMRGVVSVKSGYNVVADAQYTHEDSPTFETGWLIALWRKAVNESVVTG